MDRARTKSIITWILSILLALAFLAAGIPKLLGDAAWVLKFHNWGYSNWFVLAIGCLEVAGGILLLIPRLASYVAAMLIVVMIGATYTHVVSAQASQAIRPLLFLCLLGIVGWQRRRQAMRSATAS